MASEMRLLLIHQIFVTPSEGGGTRHYELLKFLSEKGYQVKVVASRLNYLSGRARSRSREKRNGLFIRYSYTFNALHRSIPGRAVSFLSFTLSSFLDALKFGKIDVVWGTSPPLFQSLSALLIARLRGAKFIFEVRDLWIDFAEELGVMKNKILIRLAKALEKFVYAHADWVIVNSPGFIPFVGKHVPADKIEVIPNGVGVSSFLVDRDTGRKFKRKLGLDGYFIVTYAGNIGVANDIDTIIETARLVRNQRDIKFLLVGGGLRKEEYRRQAREMGLDNVLILDPIPKFQIPKLLAATDVCLATLKNLPLFKTTYPNKVFDYMAAGKPTVLAIDGVIREVLEKAEGGVFVPPGDPEQLKEAIMLYYKNPDLREKHGENARKFVMKHFEWAKIGEDLHNLLVKLQRGHNMASTDTTGRIEFLKPADAKRVAQIHKDSIKTGFLSSLGVSFLTELYKNMTRFPNSFVLIYKSQEGRIEGFLSASTDVGSFYRFFLRKALLKVLYLLFPRILDPKAVRKAYETLRYPSAKGDLPKAELLSIAVTERARGRGVAQALFHAFLEEMRRRGVETFKVTVGEDNTRANRFYEKVGFEFHDFIEVHSGERSRVWIYDLRKKGVEI